MVLGGPGNPGWGLWAPGGWRSRPTVDRTFCIALTMARGQALTVELPAAFSTFSLFSPSLSARLPEGSCPEFTNLLGTAHSPALQRLPCLGPKVPLGARVGSGCGGAKRAEVTLDAWSGCTGSGTWGHSRVTPGDCGEMPPSSSLGGRLGT